MPIPHLRGHAAIDFRRISMPQTELAPGKHAAHAEHRDGCDCKCGCVPAEFVRMRYYYGQLLGATDLLDEQAYLIGKHRFHNARLHGWGILCGLRAGPYVQPQTNPATAITTVLKVLRGAAIDHCGNEIIVAGDYCIDVNAWFLSRKPKIESIAPTAPTPAHTPPAGGSSTHLPPPGGAQPTQPSQPGTPAKGKVF